MITADLAVFIVWDEVRQGRERRDPKAVGYGRWLLLRERAPAPSIADFRKGRTLHEIARELLS